MALEDSPERFWRPILKLGLERHYWVDDFISSWFLHGFKVEGCREAFFREWSRMIDFVIRKAMSGPKMLEMASAASRGIVLRAAWTRLVLRVFEGRGVSALHCCNAGPLPAMG